MEHDIVGVIPAAGSATRWGGGVLKELLPIGPPDEHGATGIERAALAMVSGGARRLVVVTSLAKMPVLPPYLSRVGVPVSYVLQGELPGDLWAAVRTALPFCGALNFFAMPDTVFDLDAFRRVDLCDDITLGLFRTETPERFGVLAAGRVVDKSVSLVPPQDAWGVVAWSRTVTTLWRDRSEQIASFAEALNLAMSKHESKKGTFRLESYEDFASWDDYREWVRR